jgi:Ser/Thr protein kinase RdoA (MazF antagonist)
MTNDLPDQLLEALNSGAVAEITHLMGNENENYLVRTAKRTFVVKRLRSAYSAAETELEGLYRQRVADAGLPVAPYLLLGQGGFVLTIDDSSYVATTYEPGEIASYSPVLATQTGQLLARLHTINASGLPERHAWFRESYIADAMGRMSDQYATANQAFAASRAALADLWQPGLPRGIVHGDVHSGNIIVDGQGKIVSLIDWEDTDIEPCLLDIAHAVRSSCFRSGICNEASFKAFMTAYQQIRPLTLPEKALLGPALQYSALLLSVWAYAKVSQGQISAAVLQDLGNRYQFQYLIPEVY